MAPASLKRKLVALESRTKMKKKAPAAAKKTPKKKLTTSKRKNSTKKRKDPPQVRSRSDSKLGATVSSATSPIGKPATAGTTPLTPKVEFSPNATARCRGCERKIQKQQQRFGIPEASERFNKEIYRYYHVRCCPKRFQDKVPNFKAQLAQEKTLNKDKGRIMKDRQRLLKDLKRMRLLFANRLEVSFAMIFSNDILDELVIRMPTTAAELLDIHGIGPTKIKSFGDPILAIIRQYKQRLLQKQESSKKPAASTSQRKTAGAAATVGAQQVIVIDDSSSDDDGSDGAELIMGASFTCEQLVRQKFEHAAANGYLIALDD